MGRKKRKVDPAAAADAVAPSAVNPSEVLIKAEEPEDEDEDLALPQQQPLTARGVPTKETNNAPKLQSHYAISSHSGEIISEDPYVSDGSEDSEEGFLRQLEILLQGSRTGLMRRGLHQQPLQLPNRQWTRQGKKDGNADISGANDGDEAPGGTTEEEDKAAAEAEELAQLDPAQRAARLLQEKQRREEEARLEAIQKENEDNVSRDPALFSKRTAFDIRLDQIEDKPWQNRTMDNNVNMTEYFNYGLHEEDWAEYAEQQLMIRQELTDAARQKRIPNPAIVPIQPRKVDKDAPSVPAVMVAPKKDEEEKESSPAEEPKDAATVETKPLIAPPVKVEEDTAALAPAVGGAWGVGPEPGSELARLIAEQENATKAAAAGGDKRRDSFPSQRPPEAESFHHGGHQQPYDDRHHHRMPIMPPPHYDDRYAPPPDYGAGAGRGRGDYGGGWGGYGGGRGDFGSGRGDYGGGRGDYGGHWQGGRGGGRGDFYGRGGRGRGRGPQFGGWKRPYEGEDNRWRR